MHVLCRWHIEKNLLANAKNKGLEQDDKWRTFVSKWHILIGSETEQEYDRAVYDLKTFCASNGASQAFQYVEGTWLKHKERVANAWINKRLRFGETSSSRAEGVHSTTKSYIGTATGNLVAVWLRTNLAAKAQHQKVTALVKQQMNSWPTTARNYQELDAVQYQISRKAVNLLIEQLKLTTHKSCTGVFKRTMGLPCSHHIKDHGIALHDIHPYWQLNPSDKPLDNPCHNPPPSPSRSPSPQQDDNWHSTPQPSEPAKDAI